MAKKITIETLTENTRDRHQGARNKPLVQKWAKTGLLRGLKGQGRENMAVLLENQAAQVLRESSTISTGGGNLTSSGDLRGFTNIAFPIVRRVFGGLVANELVSVQPMSLPAGLLFYLDYTYGANVGGDNPDGEAGAATYQAGQSIYNNPAGAGVRSGSLAAGGMYDLAGAGYSRVHSNATAAQTVVDTRGSYLGSLSFQSGANQIHATGTDGKLIQFDPQITNLIEDSRGRFQFLFVDLNNAAFDNADLSLVRDWSVHVSDGTNTADLAVIPETIQGGLNVYNVRRLNQVGTFAAGVFTPQPLMEGGASALANGAMLVVVSGNLDRGDSEALLEMSFPLKPAYSQGTGDTLVVPAFESDLSTTPSPAIPEIDIKVESIAVTAVTRKLRARWTPELAQDLNAYQSLDAEVELTAILSEQIALEIDREILGDLLTEANGAKFFWSRAPGKFVNKTSGTVIQRASSLDPGPAFTGTVREWYETLAETIIDVANTIHRKTLRGSANFIVTSPDVCTILEATQQYRADYNLDGNGQVSSAFSIGCDKSGTLSNRFTVYKDPYFPRNKILVGYKGGSYLETGYVYAPYVPLIVTPTIFAPEDFTPRKGVMTRYGKKMVRTDFYGTVTILDMNII